MFWGRLAVVCDTFIIAVVWALAGSLGDLCSDILTVFVAVRLGASVVAFWRGWAALALVGRSGMIVSVGRFECGRGGRDNLCHRQVLVHGHALAASRLVRRVRAFRSCKHC